MLMNALRRRLGLIGAGFVTLCIYAIGGGRMGPDRHGSIQIEYGMYPTEFEGLSVEIDGQVVGALKPFGNAHRCGFVVESGEHTVRVLHPTHESRPQPVRVLRGRPVLLILDLEKLADASGGSRSVLGFQG